MAQQDSHIVVVNVFPDDNAGSAALTWAAIELVREAHPDCSIGLIPVDGVASPAEAFRHTLERYPHIRIHEPLVLLRQRRFAAVTLLVRSAFFLLAGHAACGSGTARDIAKSRAVVARGGYVFVERGGARGVASLLATTLPLILGIRLGKPTIALPMSVGPFTSTSSRLFARTVLRRVTRVLPRDASAHETVLRLGVKRSRTRLAMDSVLAMDLTRPEAAGLPAVDARTAVLTTRHLGSGTTAALQRFTDDQMQSTVARAGKMMIERGLVDRLLIVTQSFGSDVDETRAVHALAVMLGGQTVEIATDLTPAQLVQTYSKAGIVLTQHLHSSIFSVLGGTLPIAMSTDGRKVEGTFRQMGLPDFLVLSGGESNAEITAVLDRVPADVEQRQRLLDGARRSSERHRTALVADLRSFMAG